MKRNITTEQKSKEASSKRTKCEASDSGEIHDNQASQPTNLKEEEPSISEDKGKDDIASPVLKFRKKCVAIFMCYNGFGYLGMQYNAGFKTIEGELLAALAETGAIAAENKNQLAKLNFQRASKTDKGVSAVRQIVSLKMDTAKDYLDALNAALPSQIRVLRILRTTQSFNCKYFCTSRFYQYLCPTFAFAPTYEQTYEGYRIDADTVEELGDVLSLFKGTHNFHNYTSAVKADDPSCNRYIMDISTGETLMDSKTNLEFISIDLHGQSFMLHQIRKMIGITIAIMKRYAEREIIQKSFKPQTIETPKAPSLGLMLSRQEFKGYNRKFGDDGIHQPILWDSVESEVIEFRDKHIYPHIIQQEADEKSMFHWLGHLKKHNFTSETTKEGTELEEVTPQEIKTVEATAAESQSEMPTNVLKVEECTAETNAEQLASASEEGRAAIVKEESTPKHKVQATAASSQAREDTLAPDCALSLEQ